MPLVQTGQIGPATGADGAQLPIRQGRSAEVVVQELHGRFYETNYRGALFSDGMNLTSISNVTFTTGTLGATCTPIAGVWNPLSSPVNLAVLKVVLGVTITALQATGAGPYVWATATAQSALTLGNAPLNRKTLLAAGSQAKGLAGVALTGLSGSLVVRSAAALGGGAAYNASLLGTAAGFMPELIPSMDVVDGSIIVPPGGILALLATTTAVAHSAASTLVWEEVAL